jgi:hypothetical protein
VLPDAMLTSFTLGKSVIWIKYKCFAKPFGTVSGKNCVFTNQPFCCGSFDWREDMGGLEFYYR